MQPDDALVILGVRRDADWDTIRRAHRRAIVQAHPDAGGSADAAAQVNRAFDVLSSVTENGRHPLPDPAPPAPSPPSPVTTPSRTVRADDPTEVLMQLADAAHDIGEVVFVDPDAGLLEVIVGDEPGVGQLTASVDGPGVDGVPVAFTLEPLGVTPAPIIHDVVADLMDRVRHRRRSGFRPPPATDESPR